MRAAGAHDPLLPRRPAACSCDPETVERLCARAQPGPALRHPLRRLAAADAGAGRLCRRRGMLLVEDCALSLLSETWTGRPARFVRRLVGLLPLQDAAAAERRAARAEHDRDSRRSNGLQLRHAGSASVLGRTAELLVQRIRGRANGVGAALQVVKRGMGRAAGALEVRRANVGDIGFNLDEVDLAMSRVSARLLERLDFDDIRRRRVENYRLLDAQLGRGASRASSRPCPTASARCSSRSSCRDKHAAAAALQQRGVDALEFWNDSMESGDEMGPDARFLRRHVLELPDSPGPDAAAHRARGARSLRPVGQAGRAMTPVTQAVRAPHATARHAIRVEAIDTAWGFDGAPAAVERAAARQRRGRSVPHLGMAARVVDAPGCAARCSIIAVREGDELIAIAPLPRGTARPALVLAARVPRHRSRRLRLPRPHRPARPRGGRDCAPSPVS